MAARVVVVAALLLFSFELALAQQPVISPPNDQLIAFNSPENVTYSCSVTPSRSVVWEVGRSQIRSDTQFSNIAAIGIFIEPSDTTSADSTLIVTRMARDALNAREIMISCLSIMSIDSIPGETYTIFNFFPPDAPGNLVLVPDDPTLTLEWDRPTNVPDQVTVSYIVEINSTEESELNFRNVTSLTSLSVHFLEELLAMGQCIMFDFTVRGSNEAGLGPLSSITDTVPISPDVTNISRSLAVEMVDLRPLSVQISFPPVIPCSSNFLLHNYTINIDGAPARVLSRDEVPPSPSDGMIRPTLSGDSLAGVNPDGSFSLSVTACNVVTCRTSNATTLYTTDVQRASVIFYDNRVFINCSFAVNSEARACVVSLTLTGTNDTERLEVPRDGERGSVCEMAENQKEAYNRVVAFDLEADGNDGPLGVDITGTTVVLETEEEYVQLTGCREPTDNTAAIVGGVIGGLLLLLIIALAIAGIVVGVTTGWWCGIMDSEEVKNLLSLWTPLGDLSAAGPPPPPTDLGESGRHSVEVHDAPLLGSAPPTEGQPQPTKPTSVKRSKSKEQKPKLERKKYVLVKTEDLMPLIHKT